MAEFSSESSFDDRNAALGSWWSRNGKEFSLWYLQRSTDEQKRLLLQASPDMPEHTPGTRESQSIPLKATDMLLPELSLEALLSVQGRLVVLLFTRRLTALDLAFQADILLLNKLHERKAMPTFSKDTLRSFDTPFVDPLDPEENVQALGAEVTPTRREEIKQLLATGRLVNADVWLALKLRRAAMVSFLENLIVEYENCCDAKPSPNYRELVLAEVEMKRQEIITTTEKAINRDPGSSLEELS